jgi:hypothetical protein
METTLRDEGSQDAQTFQRPLLMQNQHARRIEVIRFIISVK